MRLCSSKTRKSVLRMSEKTFNAQQEKIVLHGIMLEHRAGFRTGIEHLDIFKQHHLLAEVIKLD
jgi:hypothetical protein